MMYFRNLGLIQLKQVVSQVLYPSNFRNIAFSFLGSRRLLSERHHHWYASDVRVVQRNSGVLSAILRHADIRISSGSTPIRRTRRKCRLCHRVPLSQADPVQGVYNGSRCKYRLKYLCPQRTNTVQPLTNTESWYAPLRLPVWPTDCRIAVVLF